MKTSWCKLVQLSSAEEFFAGCPEYPSAAANNASADTSWAYGSELPEHRRNFQNIKEYMAAGIPSQKQLAAYDKAKDTVRKAILGGISRYIPDMRRRRYLADEGESVDIDAYLRRDLECWTSYTRPPVLERSLTIMLELGANYGYGEEYFQGIVGTCAAYVEILEKKGFTVQVTGAYTTGFSNYSGYAPTQEVIGAVFPLKRFGRKLNTGRFLCMGSPTVTRVFGFRWNAGFLMDDDTRPPGRDKPKSTASHYPQGSDYTPWPEMYTAMDQDVILHPNVDARPAPGGSIPDAYTMGLSEAAAKTANGITVGLLERKGAE
jgi:hypothetical protein